MLGKISFACCCLLVAVVFSSEDGQASQRDPMVYGREAEASNPMYGRQEEGDQPLPAARFFGIKITQTKLNIVTKMVTVNKSSLCASLLNVTGACRRRKRGIDKPIVLSFDEDDQIDLYKPSEVQEIEPTPLADLSQWFSSDALESSESDPVEMDIIGLPNSCGEPRRLINGLLNAFNVTLKFMTTVNVTLTKTTVIKNGSKPFFVSGCTPKPFLYKTC